MKHLVITIGCEYGAKGNAIGRKIAEDLGISRQGVHDMIKRCNHTLEEYENKLHLVDKFLNIRKQIKRIKELADQYHADEIAELSNEILEEL